MSHFLIFFSLLTPNFIEDFAADLWTAGDEMVRPTAIDMMLDEFDDRWEDEQNRLRDLGHAP